MPTDAFRRFARTLWHREPWWAEWIHAWGLILWGVLAYGSTVEMAERPNMVLLSWLSDTGWAILAGGLGLAQIFALLLDCRWGRWSLSAGALWLWLNAVYSILGTSFFAHPPAVLPLALALYLVPVMTCVLSITRLLRD